MGPARLRLWKAIPWTIPALVCWLEGVERRVGNVGAFEEPKKALVGGIGGGFRRTGVEVWWRV